MKAWCCKCNKPVDEILQLQYDFMHAYRFKVTCHGQTQEQDIPASFFRMNSVSNIEIHAFQDMEALPEPPLKQIELLTKEQES